MEREAAHSPSLSEPKLFKGRHLCCGFKMEKEILGKYLLAFLPIIIWFKPFSHAESMNYYPFFTHEETETKRN